MELRHEKCKGLCGLSVMTWSYCQICHSEIINASSVVDKICKECATRENKCRHCMEDM